MNKVAQLVFEVLAASYAYYHLNSSLMQDYEYDEKIQHLVGANKKVKIRLKNKLHKLIDWEQLEVSTSLYYIKESKYPQGVKRLAVKWLETIEEYL